MPSDDELDRIGRALAAETDEQQALALLLGEARRLTRAEAGTVYLREAHELRFAVAQNDASASRFAQDEHRRRLTATPLRLTDPSIAAYVALTRATVNIPDAYEIPLERPYEFDRHLDTASGYRTRSMLAMPIRDARGNARGVLQLINARNEAGEVIPFDAAGEDAAARLLARFAAARPDPRSR